LEITKKNEPPPGAKLSWGKLPTSTTKTI
jgi:hypothetical protein